MGDVKVTIDAVVATTRERVWERWTAPEHIVNWNFASDDWCCPDVGSNLSVGGRYRARMEAKDGSFGFDFVAIYDLVSAPQTLAYTMEDGRKVTIRFEAQGGSTKVTQTFDADESSSIDMQRDGWQAILDSFKAYVEGVEKDERYVKLV